MLCVYGSPLYQWDLNRQLLIDTVDIHSNFVIHCCHKDDTNALVIEPIFKDDAILANIPNILLQRSGFLRVYVVIEGDTVFDTSFYVIARPKPEGYVYTETEIYTVKEMVEDALIKAKESGDFNGKDGHTPVKGKDYFTEAEKAEMIRTVQDEAVGDLETSLDNIIAIQNEFMIPDGDGRKY